MMLTHVNLSDSLPGMSEPEDREVTPMTDSGWPSWADTPEKRQLNAASQEYRNRQVRAHARRQERRNAVLAAGIAVAWLAVSAFCWYLLVTLVIH
jgi:hypothetical protein